MLSSRLTLSDTHADEEALLSVVIPLVVFILIAASFLWRELKRGKEARVALRVHPAVQRIC